MYYANSIDALRRTHSIAYRIPVLFFDTIWRMTGEGKLWLSGSIAVTSALLTVLILVGRWVGGQTVASNQSTQPTNRPIAPASRNAVNYTVLTQPCRSHLLVRPVLDYLKYGNSI